jgi:hypothetical protein
VQAAQIEATAGQLRAAAPGGPPPGFWAEFGDGLQERLAAERAPALERWRRWVAAPRHAAGAAAAALVLLIVIAVTAPRLPEPQPSDPVVATAKHLVTNTMVTTLPSLGQVLDTWRDGISSSEDLTTDQPAP